jgi:uncharacterized membrane protein
MDTKRIVTATIVGAVTMHVVGYLLFDVASADFYAGNAASATNLNREVNLQWSIALGNLALAALLVFYIARSAAAPSLAGGFLTGSIVGFLVWFGVDFTFYGYEERWNLRLTIIDPFLAALQMAVAGAAISLVLARIPKRVGLQPTS